MKLKPSVNKAVNVPRSTYETPSAARQRGGLGALVVGALTLLFGFVNWMWLRSNVVTYGWDRMDHLIASLGYNNVLSTMSPQSFFEAFAWSDYYPPLVHIVAVMGYKMFGVDEDVAAMMNVIYLALLLGAVWHIGRRMGGLAVALLATLIISTFPMIYAMSRYLYIDFALTCLVALSMATLLASERFARHGASLLFGLSLGAAFLVKWTTAAFMAFPLALILWRSGVLHEMVRNPAALRPHGRRLIVCLLIGGVLAALWVLSARDIAAQQPLDLWLIPLFALLIGAVTYALTRPRLPTLGEGGQKARGSKGAGQLANALSAGAVAALTFSLWYLPNINFLQAFYTNAYGKPTGRQWGYGKYLDYIVTEQLSPLYTALFVLLLIVFLWRWGRDGFLRGGWRKLSRVDDSNLVLLLWAVVPFLLFATRVSTIHSRYLMPFLPPFALWMALGMWRLRPNALRALTIGVVMLLAWAQFAIISFDSLAEWRERFIVNVNLPIAGEGVNLLGHGFSIQYPAKGVTEPDFAVTPDILATIEEKRVAQGVERVKLGLIVNSYQVHEKHFLYQIYIRFPEILLHELARNWSGQPAYNQLFEMDYVLLNDTHTYRTFEESQQITERILSTPEERFHRAFREVASWTIPSDETITLYERRFTETTPGISVQSYQTLMDELGSEFGEGDTLILTAPDQVYIMGILLAEEAPITLLPLPMDGSNVAEAISTLESALLPALRQAQEPPVEGQQEPLGSQRGRLFLLSHNSSLVDPEGRIEGWLRTNTVPGPEIWIDALRVNAFIPVSLPTAADTTQEITFGGNGPTLHGYAFDFDNDNQDNQDNQAQKPGGALTGALYWGQTEPTHSSLKVSLQLISPAGALIAQRDSQLTPGTQPHALLIPRAIAPGDYRLILSVYQPETLERLRLADGNDLLELGVIKVTQ